MHGTTDKEKEAAKKSMMDKAVAEEMNRMRHNSEWQNYEFYVSLTFLILFVYRCFLDEFSQPTRTFNLRTGYVEEGIQRIRSGKRTKR